jgi:hypothetical protein
VVLYFCDSILLLYLFKRTRSKGAVVFVTVAISLMRITTSIGPMLAMLYIFLLWHFTSGSDYGDYGIPFGYVFLIFVIVVLVTNIWHLTYFFIWRKRKDEKRVIQSPNVYESREIRQKYQRRVMRSSFITTKL